MQNRPATQNCHIWKVHGEPKIAVTSSGYETPTKNRTGTSQAERVSHLMLKATIRPRYVLWARYPATWFRVNIRIMGVSPMTAAQIRLPSRSDSYAMPIVSLNHLPGPFRIPHPVVEVPKRIRSYRAVRICGPTAHDITEEIMNEVTYGRVFPLAGSNPFLMAAAAA